MRFCVEARDGKARAGKLVTDRGTVLTPVFMPVGTRATVKAVPVADLKNQVGATIILANTYHLHLRPGVETLRKAGGIHAFMSWDGHVLTDSGGYQVYSLAGQRKITEAGVIFASHIDGSRHFFTPENVVDEQRFIGSDVQMTLDECPPFPCEYDYARRSLELTHRWAERARKRFLETSPPYDYEQYQFGIVQGSTYKDLREKSVSKLLEIGFDGYAIGGLAVGEPTQTMYEITEFCCDRLPDDRPRYLMGVGTPANILESIARGVDMMDCVLPTRNARHGLYYTFEGVRNAKNAKYADDFSPLDPDGDTIVDQTYSKAYVRHLFSVQEWLAAHILTVHNLAFFRRLVQNARAHILSGTFEAWKNRVSSALNERL
ncbi:MAG: tRNA guanosine(34) transglycosylase Tgt [Bacteroidia bacterium]|nr:tRNA guanosine(34) transglycosylase Tgt [Bacteroidia bacterium]MDW8332780.1 tRNA guanosine(34) transglycosylase Tgt [Bacteroidia bacterium]